MRLRPYEPKRDLDALAELYTASALILGKPHYSPIQLEVWSSWPKDRAVFAGRLAEGETLVAEIEGRAAAFGQLHPYDHIALLMTHPDFARRGCATAILRALEARAVAQRAARLTTTASKVARPVFESVGFRLVEVEEAPFGGRFFTRYRMAKALHV